MIVVVMMFVDPLPGLINGGVETSVAAAAAAFPADMRGGRGGLKSRAPCIGTVAAGNGLDANLLIGTSSPNGSLSFWECKIDPLRRGSPHCELAFLEDEDRVRLCWRSCSLGGPLLPVP